MRRDALTCAIGGVMMGGGGGGVGRRAVVKRSDVGLGDQGWK